MKFDVSELPNGFFNCIVRARTPEGKFLADRELYINKYEKAPAMNRFSGMWYGHFIGHTPPLQPELEAKELIGMGVGTVYFGELDFVSPSGTPLWRSCLEMIRPMKEAGFLVGSLLQRGDQSKIRSKFMQPIELTDYFRDTVRASEGLIDFWNFSNEPNPRRRLAAARRRPRMDSVQPSVLQRSEGGRPESDGSARQSELDPGRVSARMS